MPANRYFHISNGLRGAYMPDSSRTVMCGTRRELAALLHSEAAAILSSDENLRGLSRRHVSTIAAKAWAAYAAKDRRAAAYPFCLPYGYAKGRSANYSHGLFVAVADRAQYLENREAE